MISLVVALNVVAALANIIAARHLMRERRRNLALAAGLRRVIAEVDRERLLLRRATAQAQEMTRRAHAPWAN